MRAIRGTGGTEGPIGRGQVLQGDAKAGAFGEGSPGTTPLSGFRLARWRCSQVVFHGASFRFRNLKEVEVDPEGSGAKGTWAHRVRRVFCGGEGSSFRAARFFGFDRVKSIGPIVEWLKGLYSLTSTCLRQVPSEEQKSRRRARLKGILQAYSIECWRSVGTAFSEFVRKVRSDGRSVSRRAAKVFGY